MNWDTAKNWLIMAFFVLDLILGWQFVQSRQEMSGYVESQTDLLANTRTLLAQHGFSLNTEIPTTHSPLALMAADYVTAPLHDLIPVAFHNSKSADIELFTGTAITADGKIRLTGAGHWEVEYIYPVQPVDAKVQTAPSMVWHPTDYVHDSVLDNGKTESFVRKYQNYPIFDAVLTLKLNGHRIAGYNQTAIANTHKVGAVQPVISAIDALNSLANSVDKINEANDNKIESIELGYRQKISVNTDSASQDMQNYWFPVWRIVTSSGVFYINAFTGEVSTVY